MSPAHATATIDSAGSLPAPEMRQSLRVKTADAAGGRPAATRVAVRRSGALSRTPALPRLRCACGGTCPRCGGTVIGGAGGSGAAAAPATGSACGTTPSGEDLGPTNALRRDGSPRRHPRLCRAKFSDTHLGLNETEAGLRGDNQGRISAASPDDRLTALITGCDPRCLVFRQFVKVRTFENGVPTFTPLQSCSMQIPRSASDTGFVEEQTCFFGGAAGAGEVAWHDFPGTRWTSAAAEPTYALFDFTVRVMTWDRCRGEADQTQEGRLVLRKNGADESAEVEDFRPVSNVFAFSSAKANC